MEEDLIKSRYHPADVNGDGVVSDEERDMYLEFKRKELEDQDAQRDAMRRMTWFALFGMLLYPTTIMITSAFGLDNAAGIIGDIAPTYFVAISALVAAFFGANAYSNGKKGSTPILPPTVKKSAPVAPRAPSTPKGPTQDEGELL
jgi:hypothetical protein